MITEAALSDAKLVEKTINGDTTAFAALIRRYQNQVLSTAYYHMRNTAEAEELTQDAFIRAHEKLASLQDPARFAGWLRTLVSRLCIDALRKRGPGRISLDDTPPQAAAAGDKHDVEDELHQKEVKIQVARAVDSLSSKYREVIILHYFRNLSYKEIADFLEIPARTVDSRMRKAKQLLSRKLASLHEVVEVAK